jgi:hypothetical protein
MNGSAAADIMPANIAHTTLLDSSITRTVTATRVLNLAFTFTLPSVSFRKIEAPCKPVLAILIKLFRLKFRPKVGA